MAGKAVLFGQEAREALKAGVDEVGNAVRVTMGPRGRNVVLERKYGKPIITNDGVTVASDVEDLEDPFVNTGARLAYEAAKQTNGVAGDGTSTAAILCQAMYAHGLRVTTAGYNAMVLRRGLQLAAKAVNEYLEESAVEVSGREQLEWIGAISAADPEIGRLVADLFDKLGKDAGINVEDGQTGETTVEFVDGIKFDRGLLSPYFAGGENQSEASVNKPFILLTDQKLSAASDVVPVMEMFLSSGNKDLIIIAEDIEGEALGTLVLNRLRGVINVVGVKAPAFGDRRRWMLEDYAIFTGGQLIAKEIGLGWDKIELAHLGRADTVTVTKDETIIIKGHGDAGEIERRIESIWDSHKKAKNDYDREKLSERANQLSGTVAVLNVSAPTEIEQREKKHRVEDAVSATRAALEEGGVTGGGVSLLLAEQSIEALDLSETEQIGANVVRQALAEPLMQIAENAGFEGDVVAQRVREMEGSGGFNADSGEYEDLFAAGIIDPVKVTRAAITNAVSASINLLTTETTIVDAPDETDEKS